MDKNEDNKKRPEYFKCSSCSYYDPANDEKGRCRKNPPLAGVEPSNRWPLASATDWCGEFSNQSLA